MGKRFEDMRPVKKRVVMCKKMGEEWVLYDAETESVHTLNPTAHFIWNLCDGQYSVEDMVEAIKTNFHEADKDDVFGQVQQVLDHFRAEKLLEPVQ